MQNEPERAHGAEAWDRPYCGYYDTTYGRLTPREYQANQGICTGRGRHLICRQISRRDLPIDGNDLEPVLVLLAQEKGEDNREAIPHENDRLLGCADNEAHQKEKTHTSDPGGEGKSTHV